MQTPVHAGLNGSARQSKGDRVPRHLRAAFLTAAALLFLHIPGAAANCPLPPPPPEELGIVDHCLPASCDSLSPGVSYDVPDEIQLPGGFTERFWLRLHPAFFNCPADTTCDSDFSIPWDQCDFIEMARYAGDGTETDTTGVYDKLHRYFIGGDITGPRVTLYIEDEYGPPSASDSKVYLHMRDENGNRRELSAAQLMGVFSDLPHELTHAFDWSAWGRGGTPSTWTSEMWGNIGEVVAGNRQLYGKPRDDPQYDYDISFLPNDSSHSPDRTEYCEGPFHPGFNVRTSTNCKYDEYELWGTYLYGNFPGPSTMIEDDLLRLWYHRDYPNPNWEGGFYALSGALDSIPAEYASYYETALGPVEADEYGNDRVKRLFSRYGVTRFLNGVPSDSITGPYSFPYGVTTYENLGMFQYQNWDYRGANTIPPEKVLSAEFLVAGLDSISGDWVDPYEPISPGSEPTMVRTWATDYIVLRTDPLAAPLEDARHFRVTIESVGEFPANHHVAVTWIGYDTTATELYRLPEHVVEVSSPFGTNGPNGFRAEVEIPDFGASIQSVVLCISAMEANPSPTPSYPEEVHYKVVYGPGRTIAVPADQLDLVTAMDVARPGDVIKLGFNPQGPYLGTVVVKAGVKVIGVNNPVVVGDSGPALTFAPLDDSLSTLVQGLTLQTSGAVAVRFDSGGAYAGILDRCTVIGGTTGITVSGGTKAVVSRSEIEGFSTHGMWIGNGSVLATVDSCSITGGSTGIWSVGSKVLVKNCSIMDQTSVGIYLIQMGDGDTATVQDNILFSSSSSGEWKTGVAVDSTNTQAAVRAIITGNTVSGWGTGMDLRQAPGGSIIRQNLVLNAGVYGIRADGNTGPLTIERNNSYDNGSYPPQDNYQDCPGVVVGPPGTGNNLSADPEFCFGSIDDGFNINSPCVPENNAPWGAWIGTGRVVSCLRGTLANSITLARSTNVHPAGVSLLSDFVVPAGKTLTISDGLTVSAYSMALPQDGGVDPYRNELVVRGDLVANGQPGSPVLFTSHEPFPYPGDWGGIVVNNDGDAFLTHATLEYVSYGVQGPALADTISLNACSIQECEQAGVLINNIGVSPTTTLLVTGGMVEPGMGWAGVYTVRPYRVRIEGLTVTGTSSTMYGIAIDTAGVASPQAEVANCTVSGLVTGTGIYVAQDSPILKSNWVKDCKWGIQLRGSGSPQIIRASSNGIGTRLNRCTTGLSVLAPSPSVDSLSVDVGNLSGATAISNSGTSAGSYTRVKTSGGTVAFNVGSTANPPGTFRQGKVTGFTVNGFKYSTALGGLDLGTNASQGLNSIHSTVAAGKWVSVKTCVDGGPVVSARGNYWNGEPNPTTLSACVDYGGWLESPPSPSSTNMIAVEEAPRLVGVHPNPFRAGLTFTITASGAEAGQLRVEIFDVAGRLVRELWREVSGPGVHDLAWDGIDQRGRPVGTGIYFSRLRFGNRMTTHKLVRLP